MCIQVIMDNSRPVVKKEIHEIFSSSQRTTAVHQRNSIILKQLYDRSEHEEFWSCLKNVIFFLLVNENGPLIEKILGFFGLFCSLLKSNAVANEDDEEIEYTEHPLLSEIMSFVLQTSGLSEDIIRIRSCQIINTILNCLVGAEVSLDLCEKLEDGLLKRLKDPKNTVRQQAVVALHRLQDPSNPEDVIIFEFIVLMNSDSYPKVRQLCIEKIGFRKDVVEHILNRTRDIDPHVRLAAYKRMSDLVGFLKIHERQMVLHSGFLDKSEKVKEYMSTLIIKWLEFHTNDILNFMKSLRLDADEKDLKNTTECFESVLKVIFRNTPTETLVETIPLNENRLVPIEELSWEVVSFWRIYVQYLAKEEDSDELEKVVPELVYFCTYIKQYYTDMPKEVTSEEFLEQQFILKQFFLMTRTFDFGDVSNRKCLNALVSNILENVVLISDVIEAVVVNLEYSIPTTTQQAQRVGEIISEIQCPMNTEDAQKRQHQKEYQISKFKVRIDELKDELENAVRDQDFIVAERVKNELNEQIVKLADFKNSELEEQHQVEKKTDVLTTVKCLDIAAAILKSPKVNKLTFSLKALKENFIEELLIHENDSIRVKAYKCYGLCCIIDKETAATGIHIFSTPIFGYQNGMECDTQTLLICTAAVVDILRIYGPQLMAASQNELLSKSMQENEVAVFAGGTSLTNILQGLVDLMDDDQYDIQEQAGLGLCQLILSNRIVSPSLISRLILKWCNPASDSDCNRLKQVIGFALQNIPLIPDCTEQLIEAVFMTIRALYSAPRISPLADVNVENIAKFLVALCKVSPDANYINTSLAVTALTDIIQNPESKLNGLFSKMLLMLDIPNNQTNVEELLNLCDNARDVIKDRFILNNITKINTKINVKILDLEKTIKPADMTKLSQETIIEEEEEL